MSTAAANAAEFYREVAASGMVWSIKDAQGFPAPLNRDGQRSMPFWSSEPRVLIVICEVPAYSGFVPVPISWPVFCERWVPGLERDSLLAGVNWSGRTATGFDVAPKELQRNVETLRHGNG